MQRTYGRKSLTKRQSSSVSEDYNIASRKRRKLSLEPAEPLSPSPGPPPKKLARNLSDLFESTLENIPRKTAPKGVVSRMLTRTRTESSSEGSTCSLQSSILRRESTLIVETSSKRAVTPEDDLSPPDSPSHHIPVPVTTSTRTYAGKSRSFLVAIPSSHTPSLSHNNSAHVSEDENDDLRESYTALRARWGVDNSEDDFRPPSPSHSPNGKGKGKQHPIPPPLPNGMMNDLKSITELRSKGESRRFLDEVGYLFEGLDKDGIIGIRRSSALEIVTKLCDTDFARKAKAADFLGRTWDMLRSAGAGDGDKILDIILAFYAALVARDSTSVTELSSKSDFVPTLFNLLSLSDRHKDVLSLISSGADDGTLRKAGISRTEKPSLSALNSIISKKSGIIPEGTPQISLRLLISLALIAISPSSLPSRFAPTLYHTLHTELSLIPARVTAYTTGLSLLPASPPHTDTPSFTFIRNALILLDSLLLEQWSGEIDDDHSENSLLDGLVALCVATEILSRDVQHADMKPTVESCMQLGFRVLLSLSHERAACCSMLLQNGFTLSLIMRVIVISERERVAAAKNSEGHEETEDEHSAQSLDLLCLSLGLLTNLVQSAHEAKELVEKICIDPDCINKRHCVRGCRCAQRVSALACLVAVYQHQLAVDDAGSNFLRGHIAVLFGLLMHKCPTNQHALLEALPGTSNCMKLNSLVERAREFVAFYTQLTARLAAAARGSDEDLNTGPDSSSSPHVKQLARDGKGEIVARDVILFLETLRDEQLA